MKNMKSENVLLFSFMSKSHYHKLGHFIAMTIDD